MRCHSLFSVAICFALYSGSAAASLASTLQTLQNNLQTLQGNMQTSLQTLQGNLEDSLQTLQTNLTEGWQQAQEQLEIGLARLQHSYLFPTEGTIAFEEAVEHEGVGRRALYIRPLADPVEPAPVIILLHYATGTAEDIANATRIGDLVAATGAWAIVPEGRNQRWNDDPESATGADDVGYLAKVIETATARYALDPTRIYVAGMSNGGFMATRLACERPELIAAVASVAASMRPSHARACASGQTMPMMLTLGTSDLYVWYNGGLGLMSAQETFRFWGQINDCDPSAADLEDVPDTAADGTRTIISHGVSCAGDTALYSVEGGGHTWPQWSPAISPFNLGRVAEDFNGTQAIWAFFESQRRP